MSHTALARKHRPIRFSEVATQSHVSETLRRAVAGGRVGHAYLFCGPRGVGKTTLARVLAMALNCPNRTDEGEPCGTCDSCQRIWGGHTALDVVEIDAASNRGVDDARELRARAQYAPSEEGRYKVYILDEAHMLTREAWNALLKILEEPPPRVIFVFATTEPQKIQQSAAPILSRCQRFDFRRIGVADIVTRLQEVLAREGLEGPDDALRTIARKADGGMRDGLSLLDQVIALTGGPVTQEAVRRILGLVEEERYLDLVDILLAREPGRVFRFVDGLVDDGYDLVEFYHGLVETLRLLLRVRLEGDADLTDVREDLRQGVRERAARFDAPDLVRMLALAAELEVSGSLRRTVHPRMLVEMLLLRLSYLDRTVDLEELLRGLGGTPPPVPGGAPAGDGSGAAGTTTPVTGGIGARPAGATDGALGSPASHAAPGTPETGGTRAETAAAAPQAPDAPPPEAHSSSAPEATAETGPGAPPPGNTRLDDGGTAPGSPLSGDGTSTAAVPEPAHTPGAAATPSGPASEAMAPQRTATGAPEAPTADPAEAWRRVLRDRRGIPNGLGPFLRAAVVRTDPQGAVEVSLPPGPGLERLGEPRVHAAVEQALHAHLVGTPPLVVVRVGAVEGPQGRITTEAVRQSRLKELVEREPLLGKAVEELDLELLD